MNTIDWEAYLQQQLDNARIPKDKLKDFDSLEDGQQVDELYISKPRVVSFNAEDGNIFHAMAEALAINNKQSIFDEKAIFHVDSSEVEEKSIETTDL